MDLKDIEKIVKLMDSHGLTQFKLQQEDTKLELKKGADIDMEAIQRFLSSAPAPQPVAAVQAPVDSPAAESSSGSEVGGRPSGVEEITSPMVGTFYTTRDPDSPSFVQVGDKVEADSVVCIIEAMKVFNDIVAEKKGEIVDILVETGTSVQYGEPLFLVKTS